MKNCTDCKHAEWKRREGGNLHPSGDGKCKYPWEAPFSFKKPYDGAINRRRALLGHCPHYTRDNT